MAEARARVKGGIMDGNVQSACWSWGQCARGAVDSCEIAIGNEPSTLADAPNVFLTDQK